MATIDGKRLAMLVALCAGLTATPAIASTYVTQTTTCPVGGEKFKESVLASNTTFGSRPDGKPYSIAPAPFPISECPGNHLLIFDDFSGEDIARLPAILSSAEYAGWIADETQYYRAAMLAKALGRPVAQQANLMRAAVWEADDDPVRHTRYLGQYLLLAEAALPQETGNDAFWRTFGIVNAERELGRFDAAAMRLATLTVADLDEEVDADDRAYLTAYLVKMGEVIAAQDTGIEPFELIPERRRVERCVIDDGPLSENEVRVCASSELASEIKEMRDNLAGYESGVKLR